MKRDIKERLKELVGPFKAGKLSEDIFENRLQQLSAEAAREARESVSVSSVDEERIRETAQAGEGAVGRLSHFGRVGPALCLCADSRKIDPR